MTPTQTPHREPEPVVDMSPHAIMARLVSVGQLNDLCRFLASGKLMSRRDAVAKVEAESGSIAEVRYFLEFVRSSKRGVAR